MIILGIDPGFARLGFAIIKKEVGKITLLEAGTVETDKKEIHHNRLLEIETCIRAIIKKWHPTVLSIERLFFAGNQKTAIPVAEARGVILLTAARENLTVYEYTPPQMKLAVTGSGKADKQAVQKMVFLTLGLKTSVMVDDTTDAIALAITAAYNKLSQS